MLCPVCKKECGTGCVCNNCGFDQFRLEFLSSADADDWLQKVVIPYRQKFYSQDVIASVDWTRILYQSKEIEYFLDITVPAALKQSVPIGHTLLICPHNQLVYEFVSELNTIVPFGTVLCSSESTQIVEPPVSLNDIMHSSLIKSYERIGDMIARITTLSVNSIFVQTGPMLPTAKEPKDILSSVLTDFTFDISIGKGVDVERFRLDAAPFTLLAFAEKESDIPKHYLQFFENIIHCDLGEQKQCELEAITTAISMGYSITRTAAKEIAARTDNRMRKAAILTRRICDYLLVKEPDNRSITDAAVNTVLSQIL